MDINSPPDTLSHYVMYLNRNVRTIECLTTVSGVRTEIETVVVDANTGVILLYIPQLASGIYPYAVYDKKNHSVLGNGQLIIDRGLATISSKTTTYTLTDDDKNTIIECSGTFTVTAPADLGTGWECTIVNVGTGAITIASAGTLQSKGSAKRLTTQYSAASLYHRGSDVHLLFGDIST
jgi:hypothetical protein